MSPLVRRIFLPLLLLLLVGPAAGQEQQADVRVLRLQVIDAETGRLISFVRAGEVVDLTEFEQQPLTLVALTEPSEIGAVRFYVDGHRVHQEQAPPYAIGGRTADGELVAWDPPEGEHTLIVVPIETELGPDASLSDATDRGEVGPWYEVEFRMAVAPEEDGPTEMAEDAEDADEARVGNAEEAQADAEDAEEARTEDAEGAEEAQAEDADDAEDAASEDDAEEERSRARAGEEAADEGDRGQEEASAGDDAEPAEVAAVVPREEEGRAEPDAEEADAQQAEAEAPQQTIRVRWPLERMSESSSVRGDVLLSRYPDDTVILAVQLNGPGDHSRYRLSLKRNGCNAPGERLVDLEPVDERIGTSLTPIGASFSAIRYGNFGVVVTPAGEDEPLACATLALDERVQ